MNLLKFSQLTRLKDFYFISTTSISEVMCQDSHEQQLFTEDDQLAHSDQWTTIYNQTKYIGEQYTLGYRVRGIKSNIYRIGNLACMQNGKLQENVEDNAFFKYLRFLIQMKCIPREMSKVEISPADKTAEAIVCLFDKKELVNSIYHIFNPDIIDLSNLLEFQNNSIHQVPFTQFVDKIIDYVEHCQSNDLVGRFLLRSNVSSQGVLNDKTEHILKLLGFFLGYWLWISQLFKFIKKKEIG